MNPTGCASFLLLTLAFLALACRSSDATDGPGREAAASEWVDLFTGDAAQLEANFKGFRSPGVPAGWQAQDGAVTLVEPGCGDLVTRADYDSFELKLEWRISPRGNSGIMFHVSEAAEFHATYSTGPEMQVLDNATFDGAINGLHAAGANYALHASPEDYSRPVGEWNTVRMVVDQGHVEHWLNGHQCCAYTLGSKEWSALVAASKFKDMPGYGIQGTGKIALQDHGNEVAYREVRIRRL